MNCNRISRSGNAFVFVLCAASSSMVWAEMPLHAPSQTTTPVKLDLTRFKLAWQDEFEGDKLDTTRWQAPVEVRQGTSRWNPALATVKEGMLRLGIKKLDDAVIRYEVGGVRTQRDYDPAQTLFEQRYGYFEVRCKLPRDPMADYWGAFWMMSGKLSDDQGDTRRGTEIDILETFNFVPYLGHVMAFHWNGYGAKHNSAMVPCGKHLEVLDGKFHTFGFYWDEKIYVSFIDGVEAGRTDMLGLGREEGGRTKSTGTSREPAHLLLTCEAAPWAGKASTWEKDMPAEDEFLIDYVRAYTGTLVVPAPEMEAKK